MRTLVGRHAFGGMVAAAALLVACGDDEGQPGGDGGAGSGTLAGPSSTASGGPGGGAATGTGGESAGAGTATGTTTSSSTGTGGAPPLGDQVVVTLVTTEDVSGPTLVNFAVPLQPGQLLDPAQVVVLAENGDELPAARRGLAAHADGSPRAVQIQVELDPTRTDALLVVLGTAPSAGDRPLAPVTESLHAPEGIEVPRVWPILPASWLTASGVAGPLVTESEVDDPALTTWESLCDAEAWGLHAFLAEDWESDRGVWLYDRGTTLYRAHARSGEEYALLSAFTETSLYRARISGAGAAARNGVPGGANDPKYQYAQNLAIHHLLTGDDRFREAAEDMALGMTQLWPSPEYGGGTDEQWTERNQGFALLATTWAAIVSDDRRDELLAAADAIVEASLAVQANYPLGWDDPDHRCFAHHGDAHDPGEGNPYFGCSPWMSAILADGLDAYARLRGGARAEEVRASLVQLGRIVARDGIGPDGKPHYWMGVGTDQDAPDAYDEHIGESAYVVALARALVGAPDAELDGALEALLTKLAADGTVGQIRSFNWQCRSAVMTPSFAP